MSFFDFLKLKKSRSDELRNGPDLKWGHLALELEYLVKQAANMAAVGRTEDSKLFITQFLVKYFKDCSGTATTIRRLTHVSYFIAYRLIPNLAHQKWNEFVQLWEPGIPFSTYIPLNASLILKTALTAEQLLQFNERCGSLNETTKYYLIEFPKPPPFGEDDYNEAIEAAIKVKNGSLENNVSEFDSPTLGPYFACVLHNTLTKKRDVYILGQSIGGQTTLRCVSADGGNANCGCGPEPSVETLLSCLKKIVLDNQKVVAPAISRVAEARRATHVSQFFIGEQAFCEPDYQQIMLWAEALKLEPEAVLERLLAEPKESWQEQHKTQITNGRIIKLGWDISLLPLKDFEWLNGLVIKSLNFFIPYGHDPVEKQMAIQLPELRRLCCKNMGLTGLDLSNVPLLKELYCHDNKLTELDLSRIPQIENISFDDNQITSVDLTSVPQLRWLSCAKNNLKSLDLSAVSQLTYLACSDNHLTELDLFAVPQIAILICYNNMLTTLDIRSLDVLNVLQYDEVNIHVIKRSDQSF